MEIEDRLTTMEKRLRFHRSFTVCVFVLLLGESFLDAFLPTLSGDIICDSLTVVDDEGKVMVSLGSDEAGGGVMTFSPEETPLVRLGVTSDGNGAVTTFAPENKPLVRLNASPGGSGCVLTLSPEGESLVKLGVTTGGNGGVWTKTKSGRKNRLD